MTTGDAWRRRDPARAPLARSASTAPGVCFGGARGRPKTRKPAKTNLPQIVFVFFGSRGAFEPHRAKG